MEPGSSSEDFCSAVARVTSTPVSWTPKSSRSELGGRVWQSLRAGHVDSSRRRLVLWPPMLLSPPSMVYAENVESTIVAWPT